MGCTPSMLLDHKKGHRDSTESQDQVLSCKGGIGGPTGGNNGKTLDPAGIPRSAPRASMDSDGFSVQLGPTLAMNTGPSNNNKKDSYVSQMGNNFSTSLHIKRISVRKRDFRSPVSLYDEHRQNGVLSSSDSLKKKLQYGVDNT